jgi:symplekin
MRDAPPPVLDPNTAPLDVEDDEDDYEPDYYAAEDTEQILNKLDLSPPDLMKQDESEFGAKVFKLPPPPDLTPEMGEVFANDAVERLLEYLKDRPEGSKHNPKAGVNRLAARFNDRESWFTFASRLATHQGESESDSEEVEVDDKSSVVSYDLGFRVREILYNYVMEDFRKRIDAAVSWLNEEWYNEQKSRKAGKGSTVHYEKWTLKLIDGILPYLTPQDKVLTRFLSELPELTPTMLSRVKQMCRDPSVVQLALTTLLYLVMMRPPVKDVALDTVQDIWTECKSFLPHCPP